MKRIPPTKEQIRLFALIAYREGEISEERCCEITGIRREDLRAEMERRVGLSRPFTELTAEVERLTKDRDEARRRAGLFETQYEALRSRVRKLEGELFTLIDAFERTWVLFDRGDNRRDEIVRLSTHARSVLYPQKPAALAEAGERLICDEQHPE